MKMSFATFGWSWELFSGGGYSDGVGSLTFRNQAHAENILHTLIAHEKDLSRVRAFMSEVLGRKKLANLNNIQILTSLARDLHLGTVLLRKTAVLNRQVFATGKKIDPIIEEKEVWVEMEPVPPPEEKVEELSVSHDTAKTMAQTNRELAESGTPLKEICSGGACEVCNAQLKMMAA
jgi:hypothetical protein